jgi:tetratricopeptide (TPR) repeat protein
MLPARLMLTTKKFARKFPALAAGVLLVSALSGCTPPGAQALLEGEQLIQERKFSEAIPRLKQATELLPQNAQAWNHLALAFHGSGQSQDAIRAYRQALAPGRNLPIAHYNLGCLFFEQGDYPAAVEELRAYTVLVPKEANTWLKLGVAQLRASHYDAADRSFRMALNLDPKLPEAWNGLGVASCQRNRLRDAVPWFNAALQVRTNYGPALFNLAVAYQRSAGTRALALPKFRQFLDASPAAAESAAAETMVRQLEMELQPTSPPVLTNAVSTNAAPAAKTNLIASAPPVVTVTNQVPVPSPVVPARDLPTPGVEPPVSIPREEKGTAKPKLLAEASTTPATAAPSGKKSSQVPPVSTSPQPSVKRYAYRSPATPVPGNHDEAGEFFAQGVKVYRAGQYAEAVSFFSQAVRKDPAYFAAHYNLGLAAHQGDNVPLALEAYETALAIQPTSLDARYNFALALRKGNYFEEAANEFEKLLVTYPAEARAHLSLANLFAQQLERKDRAREHYLQVLKLDPRHPQATEIRYWLAGNP